MKLGIDIHHVIDHDPKFFSSLAKAVLAAGGEIHVLTGSIITENLKEELRNYGMEWTKLFSIADYYKDKPDVEMWYDSENRPWVSTELWNMAKATYAKEEGLDLVIDDTAVYGDYFTENSFAFCKIINKSGIKHRPKAVMPPAPSSLSKQKPVEEHGKVIDIDNKSKIYKDILNRKME